MNLENIYPPLKIKTIEIMDKALKAGHEIIITQGYRSFASQNALYAEGRTHGKKIVTNARGGQSYHNYGLAVDFAFVVDKKVSWDDHLPWSLIGDLGKQEGLQWGGDWKFKDRPHLQYPVKLDLKELEKLFHEGGLKLVWERIK